MLTAGYPKILGIVNITEDSFSDGGRYLETQAAIDHALALIKSGADIIDLGPASSNPDAKHVTAETEIERLRPLVSPLEATGAEISIDSFQPATQRWAMTSNVDYLNDIEGFANPEIYPELKASGCQLFLMHSIQRKGIATRIQSDPNHILDEISLFFDERLAALVKAGISKDRIILDPGMGFFLGENEAASVKVLQNLALIRDRFDLPLLISVSRKSFLRKISMKNANESGAATLAAEIFAAMNGADYIRTHDAAALHDALKIIATLSGRS